MSNTTTTGRFLQRLGSMQTAFIVVITPVMIVISLTLMLFKQHQEYQDIEDYLETKVNLQADSQGKFLARPLWNVDDRRVQGFLESMHDDPDFAGSAVFDDNGILFGSTGVLAGLPLEEVYNLNARFKNPERNYLERYLLYCRAHLFDDGKASQLYFADRELFFSVDGDTFRVGHLVIALSDDERIKGAVYDLWRDGLGIILVTTVLVVTTLLVYSQTTSKPLEKLHQTIRQIREGKVGSLVDWQSESHIGRIIREFNGMQFQQQQLMQDLEDSRDELQQKIEELRESARERSKLEAHLMQVQKLEAVGTLAGGIAHDFNNILAIMIGYAEIAKEECDPDSTMAQDLDGILASGQRAKELIQQVLDFSRQREHEQIAVHPGILVKESLKMLRTSLPATIEIVPKIDDTAGPVLMDPNQLSQVVMNLCTNAYHAMESDGGVMIVGVAARELTGEDLPPEEYLDDGEYVLLTVGDTGKGMQPEEVRRAFEPYFTTKSTDKGSGMGLAVVHGIVKSCKGFVRIKSEVGSGTVMEVFLPVMRQTSPDNGASHETQKGSGEHILLVDDEVELAKVERTLLERLGYQVTMYTSSSDALRAFYTAPQDYDLIITDQTMPEMTGAELVEEARRVRQDIPVIICTGYSSSLSEQKALSLGIHHLAYKPMARKEMSQLIRVALSKN